MSTGNLRIAGGRARWRWPSVRRRAARWEREQLDDVRRRREAGLRREAAHRSGSRSRSRATSPIRATRRCVATSCGPIRSTPRAAVLGRKVVLKVVDDTSSPNQVVTNYQTLINRDHVDLTFGPFSTLLTAPAAAVANRYGYAFPEPAGGGRAVFKESSATSSSSSPRRSSTAATRSWRGCSRCRPDSAQRRRHIRRSTIPSPRRSSIARARARGRWR